MTATFNRGRDAASYFGIESTFISTPSMTRIFPVAGSVEIMPEQQELEVEDQSTEIHDYKATARGLKGGTVKWSYHIRPPTAQLDTTATASTSEIGMFMLAAFGGEFPTSGTTNCGMTNTGGSATSLVLSGGHGARANKGQILFPQVSSVTEPGRVIQIATDTLTLMPALSGSPSNSTVYNGYNYYPTNTNTNSFTFQHALAADSSQQWTLAGCVMTGLEFDFTLGQIPKLTCTAKIGTWVGPSAQALTITPSSSAMGSPFAMRNNQLLLQPVATTSYPSAWYSAPKVSIKLSTGLDHIPDLSGTEGKVGVMKTGERLFAEWTITAYPDITASATTADATWWTSQTPLQSMLRVPQGSGSSKRWLVLDTQTGVLVGKPKLGFDGNRETLDLVLRSQISTAVTSPTTSDALQRAPLIFAIG